MSINLKLLAKCKQNQMSFLKMKFPKKDKFKKLLSENDPYVKYIYILNKFWSTDKRTLMKKLNIFKRNNKINDFE